jgi:hypothetical protein
MDQQMVICYPSPAKFNVPCGTACTQPEKITVKSGEQGLQESAKMYDIAYAIR